ncbi:MAG: endonuclease [Bacteroidales bacterium]|nr:endonuclease [Bacteroidales bacterium]
MKTKTLILTALLLTCGCATVYRAAVYQQEFIVMFYNLENMFDIIDSPDTNDSDFTPDGAKNWTRNRYEIKKKRIWQVIASVGEKHFPDIIGICEIENQEVLNDILRSTPLGYLGYEYYYHETLDRRGIDVAFLYRSETFMITDTTFIPISFPTDPTYHSRDIVYVKGIAKEFGDTLHVFVNHWPSRYSGRIASEELRMDAAHTLRHRIDSVLAVNSGAKIVCIGDFNDSPLDKSVNEGLGSITTFDTIQPAGLYHLAHYMQTEKKMWTYKYQGVYDILDQIFVSGNLMLNHGLCCTKDDAKTVDRDFILEYDVSGPKPKRTYIGMKYNDGFSDHLPVTLTLHEPVQKK